MRKPAITASRVFEEADKLVNSGRTATPTVLYRALGSGSLSTITKHLRAWKRDNDPNLLVPTSVTPLFENLWQSAVAEATRKVTASDSITAMACELQEARKLIQQYEQDRRADTACISTLKRRIVELEAELLTDNVPA